MCDNTSSDYKCYDNAKIDWITLKRFVPLQLQYLNINGIYVFLFKIFNNRLHDIYIYIYYVQ